MGNPPPEYGNGPAAACHTRPVGALVHAVHESRYDGLFFKYETGNDVFDDAPAVLAHAAAADDGHTGMEKFRVPRTGVIQVAGRIRQVAKATELREIFPILNLLEGQHKSSIPYTLPIVVQYAN